MSGDVFVREILIGFDSLSRMATLFISLGTSPAIVPEAFLLPEIEFSDVHVLTTDSTNVSFVEEWFASNARDVILTITRVADFKDFKSEEDHFRFEEVLYRWMIAKRGSQPPFVCLSGGFKTMSAAMQKAAAVLGAAEVFHVLCDLPQPQQPKTADEIEAAFEGGHLRWIKLGAETGWPQFREDVAPSFPLECVTREGSVAWVAAPDHAFRQRLAQIVARSHQIARNWDALTSLPFQILATWSAADLDWLAHPVDPEGDRAWVAGLPKVELHCHLGGFATHGEPLQQICAAADSPGGLEEKSVPPLPSGWPLESQPVSLEDYMRLGDANGRALLSDPGCLRRQCELLYEHLVEQNVVYAEIRCSPANYASAGRSPWTVLQEIKETFDRCMSADVTATVPVAAPDILDPRREFRPFDRDASYRQTWRDLPHRHQAGATVYVTFRLADSLPKERIQQWHRDLQTFLAQNPKPWNEATWMTYRRRFPEQLEAWLDEAHGACVLGNPAIAQIVEGALHYFDGDRYILDAWVIMPNHVHVLIKPLEGHTLDSILHSWKSFTAKEINAALGTSGQLWDHESFDHLLRSAEQLDRVRRYITSNPEKAGIRSGFRSGCGVGVVVAALGVPGEAGGTPASTDQPRRRPAVTHVNLLLIATRRPSGSGDYRAAISRHLALAVTAAEHWKDDSRCSVVGVDLAGFEDVSTRAQYFREEFTAIHRCGLALTVHAGENDDAEGIWRAVFDLNARRLGHALHLAESPDLLGSVSDRGIGVEMCPYANYQIRPGCVDEPGGIHHARCGKYPLREFLNKGVAVTVNTDNIGISAGSLTDNLVYAARLCPGLPRMDLLRLQANALAIASSRRNSGNGSVPTTSPDSSFRDHPPPYPRPARQRANHAKSPAASGA